MGCLPAVCAGLSRFILTQARLEILHDLCDIFAFSATKKRRPGRGGVFLCVLPGFLAFDDFHARKLFALVLFQCAGNKPDVGFQLGNDHVLQHIGPALRLFDGRGQPVHCLLYTSRCV